MKFCLKEIVLWLKNGKQRTLKFEENKVNLITGKQSTGKSTIIEIIDYCFFASTKSIPEGEIIDKNVEWYGINFLINDKHFTIARYREEKLEQYYFSSIGEIPLKAFDNYSRKNLKNIIDAEFSLNGNMVFPYGGRKIKKNSTISSRYFMLFNTQRRDTLSNKDVLFDKQTDIKYNEALERIFDIALGLSTVENLKKIEKLREKEQEQIRLENKAKLLSEKKSDFNSEVIELCLRAKQLRLIPDNIKEDDCLDLLKQKIKMLDIDYLDNSSLLVKYEEKRLSLELKKSRYNKYLNQYSSYQNLLKKDLDSLQPIEYLKEEFQDILDLDNKIDILVNSLSEDFQKIKTYVSSQKHPATIELKSIIKSIDIELKEVNKNISLVSKEEESINITQKQQLLFLGEVKAKIPLYTSSIKEEDYTKEIKNIENSIKLLKKDIDEVDRTKVLSTLNELMYEIFNQLEYKLGGYEEYKPFFDIKSKQVFLKTIDKMVKQSDLELVKNIGSSSNHLFLHLAFFLSIHRLFVKQKVPFIPEFLILDQPNTPYYTTTDDKEKEVFFKALKMLDEQINYFNNELKRDFQIILLEHVEWKEILKNGSFKNYHLVEEWREEGEGLIPKNLLSI